MPSVAQANSRLRAPASTTVVLPNEVEEELMQISAQLREKEFSTPAPLGRRVAIIRPVEVMRNAKSSASTPDTNQQIGGQVRGDPVPDNSSKVRELAAWYREFAERAGNPTIWEARLRMADELDAEADYIDQMKRADPQRRGVADR